VQGAGQTDLNMSISVKFSWECSLRKPVSSQSAAA
jgi:hypothetical protein